MVSSISLGVTSGATSCVDAVQGMIFNIQRYCVHDGPGIRTLVFFKGCPLHCRWCSNPESQGFRPELGYNDNKCLGCGACVAACPAKALALTPQGVVRQRDVCAMDRGDSLCGTGLPACVRACPAKALTVYGSARTVEDVLDEVEQDSVFYSRSGGGMTLSGGEAFAQPAFALALLRGARQRRIHCAAETCALMPQDTFLEVCGLLDYLLLDIKCMDETRHRLFTGFSNAPVLANAQAVRKAWPALPIHVRTPVIPGFNDSNEEIHALADFAHSLNPVRFELLAYHSMGRQKYHFLNLAYPMGDVALKEAHFNALVTRFAPQ